MILKTDERGPKIAKNFYLKELMNSMDGNFVLYPDPSLGPKLQKVRDILGSMTITSATRTKAFNTKVGGSSNSYHLQGLAIDFKANFSDWTKMALVKVFVACGFTNMKFYYVYILQSESDTERHYIGFTDDLESRLVVHNQGKCRHTSKYLPWKIKTAVAFTDKDEALDFEKYLKTVSGRAFVKKRL